MPVTPNRMFLQVWNGPGVAKLVFVPFGQFLLLPNESGNESETIVEQKVEVTMTDTHTLFQKYQKAFDSLQNVMELMENKWMGKCPDNVYYSDESSKDNSVQVSWATGMNTEIALRNGEADWVVFKKKLACMQYAKQCWIARFPCKQWDPSIHHKFSNTDAEKDEIMVEIETIPVEVCYKTSGVGNHGFLLSEEDCLSEDDESITVPHNMDASYEITGKLRTGIVYVNKQMDQAFNCEQDPDKNIAHDSQFVTTPTSVGEGTRFEEDWIDSMFAPVFRQTYSTVVDEVEVRMEELYVQGARSSTKYSFVLMILTI
jgi:hypothetical protein